ncbi:MAG TPA: HAMP domain-containing sensor histidine kinase [Gaiellaceae bacterium]|jgi:two-component system sensor histidine kinase MprB|nr:HAMP domain-containing sensor histidine kinase [Gaiellaceae bacterium]
MSFRQRLMLFTALAIAVTVAGASAAVWVVAKHELYAQLDQTLLVQAQNSDHGPFGGGNTLTIHADGDRTGNNAIPVTSRALRVARGGSGYTTNTTIEGVSARELVVQLPFPGGGAIISVYPLAPTQHALSRIRFWILLVGIIGIALAAGLAALVATAALLPVRRLTAAAENVAATGDLTERVDGGGKDELGRLATRFNAMLAALEESVGRQRRLVADASHELRTPLTSTRTNIDLLREGRLPEDEARRALDEAAVELAALTTLVSDLVELARGEERKLRVEEVHLDDLVGGAVERAKSRAPDATFVTSLSPTVVRADPVLLERAVLNLLDNAVKYSPPGAPIEVTVREGEVIVADHGPGVADEDVARIFDRFYRSAGARSKPGAGLGLAIVREAARAHGGDATVESSPRGARFHLTLPASA